MEKPGWMWGGHRKRGKWGDPAPASCQISLTGAPLPSRKLWVILQAGPLALVTSTAAPSPQAIDQPGTLGAPTAQPTDQSLEQTDTSFPLCPCHGSQASLLRGPLRLRSRCALVRKDNFGSKYHHLLLSFMAATSISFLTLFLIFYYVARSLTGYRLVEVRERGIPALRSPGTIIFPK